MRSLNLEDFFSALLGNKILEESFGDCLAYDEVESGLGGGFDRFRLIINVRSSSLTVVHTYKWMNIVEYICCQVIVLHTADIAFQVASNIFTNP